MWDGKPAVVAPLPVRGRFRPIATPNLAIINIRLGEFEDGGDPAFLAYHYLSAFYPASGTAKIHYFLLSLDLDPEKVRGITAWKKKLGDVAKKMEGYVALGLLSTSMLILRLAD
jgi:hypothetical protein